LGVAIHKESFKKQWYKYNKEYIKERISQMKINHSVFCQRTTSTKGLKQYLKGLDTIEEILQK